MSVSHDDFEDDPVLAELRRIRDQHAAAYGYDIERQVADSRRMQFLFGSDLVGRGPTGELEVVFKGTGKLNFDALRVTPSAEPVEASSDE